MLAERVLKTLKDSHERSDVLSPEGNVNWDVHKNVFPLEEAQKIPIARITLCTNSQNEINKKSKVFKKGQQKNDGGTFKKILISVSKE